MYNVNQDRGIYIEKQSRELGFSMDYEHSHNYYEIYYLLKGKVLYSVNSIVYQLMPGDVFIVLPNERHYTHYNGNSECERINVYCTKDAVPDGFFSNGSCILDTMAHSGKIILPRKTQVDLSQMLTVMLRENNHPDQYSESFLKLKLMELLLLIARNGTVVSSTVEDGGDNSIDKVLKYIETNFNQPLSLEDVAEIANLSPAYFSRKFKKETGITFKDYLNFIRNKRACQALITTDDSVTKIAADCGFSSSNYFKDIFRRMNGISPREYRKRMAENTSLPRRKQIPVR